ncbi:MAG TPA: ATP-binding protein [Arcobacter sp.]|nr:ATP-binding protein [Arcobacter sp.]HIP56051.1 ATP-binding protein [Arcobacter sp.]
MISPFSYDYISKGENFISRDDEFKVLQEHVKYSTNLLIHSKRRMGKTTLIKNFFEQNDKEYLCVYIDIFEITSKEDFAVLLLNALTSSYKKDLKQSIKKFTELFKRVRVEPTINPKTLEYSLKPIVATLSFEQMIEDFFLGINELSKSNKIIVAIDEFQQIANITDVKLDAILRKNIQERENISYIFLGSKRHLLTSLFEYKAPLYEMATHFELKALGLDAIYEYVKKYLDITKELCEYIYAVSNKETKILQHIFHILYTTKKDITKESIDNTVEEIVNSKDGSYKLLFDTLNNNQKLALKIVGYYKKNFFVNDILTKYNIKKQTLQSAINALFKKELIDKVDDKYFIPDRTLELWCERMVNV